MKEENTVYAKLYPDGRVVQEMPDGTEQPFEDNTDSDLLRNMTDEEVEANAFADPEWTGEDDANSRPAADARQIRLRLSMTQVQFAETFGIALGTLRDWEQLPVVPDRAAASYLRVIEKNPNAVIEALNAYRGASAKEEPIAADALAATAD